MKNAVFNAYVHSKNEVRKFEAGLPTRRSREKDFATNQSLALNEQLQ